MNIVICVKPIPSKLLYSDSNKNYSINPYDLYALKQLNNVKRKLGIKVFALVMGRKDNRIISEIKYTGADEVFLISDKLFAGADTYATVNTLYKCLKMIDDIDVVVCGDHAIDGETGHVGAALARKLGFYFIRGVVALFDKNDKLCFKTHSLKNEKTFMVKNKCVLSFNEVELKEVILPMIAVRKIDNVDYHLITNEKLKMEPSMCGLKGSKTCVAGVNSIQSDSCRKKMCLDVNSEDSYNTVLKIIREVSR